MLDVFIDALIDTLKLIPFLFITYLIMEYIENKTKHKSKETIKKSGKLGPLVGGIVGIFPQCGFSVSATNLYAARLISIGTLIAVYLSTSDEMIPILLSEAVPIKSILIILAIKLLIGVTFGFLIDFIFRLKNRKEEEKIVHLCEDEHCHCEDNGILKSAFIHTKNITIYIFILTFILNFFIYVVGEENISTFITNNKVLGPIVCSLIGLIPNCAASVIITNLYASNVINAASLIAGLLTGAGVGLIVLFRMNKHHIKENILILVSLYLIGVSSGLVLQLLNITI